VQDHRGRDASAELVRVIFQRQEPDVPGLKDVLTENVASAGDER
jgi:hypothetical protein